MTTCFFLGAGASAAFGYPVTGEIMPLIKSGLDDGSLFGASAEKIGMAEALNTFLRAVYPGFDEPSAVLPNITEVLSLLDYSAASSTTPRLRSSISDLARFRTLLEVAICVVISKRSTQTGQKLLNQFWQWVREQNNESHDSVRLISTNYDCAIETALSKTTEFDEMTRKVDFGFDWRDPEREKPYQRPAEPWLRYYKLHGSLNWLRCDFCDHIFLNYNWEIWSLVLLKKITSVNSCYCGHGKLGLVLVTPSYVRSVREPNLLEIWRHAVEALRTADEWVISGYSVPPDDVSIRSMLIRAYTGRGKPPRVTIVTRNEDKDRDARYRLLFPKCHFERAGFAKYVAERTKA